MSAERRRRPGGGQGLGQHGRTKHVSQLLTLTRNITPSHTDTHLDLDPLTPPIHRAAQVNKTARVHVGPNVSAGVKEQLSDWSQCFIGKNVATF